MVSAHGQKDKNIQFPLTAYVYARTRSHCTINLMFSLSSCLRPGPLSATLFKHAQRRQILSQAAYRLRTHGSCCKELIHSLQKTAEHGSCWHKVSLLSTEILLPPGKNVATAPARSEWSQFTARYHNILRNWGNLSPDTSQPVMFCIWKHTFTCSPNI